LKDRARHLLRKLVWTLDRGRRERREAKRLMRITASEAAKWEPVEVKHVRD
jgi:hypothetical protein